MGKIKLLIFFAIAYYIIFPSGLSAELSAAQFEIIRVAYMNGYSNAMQADLNTIKALKEDQAKLKKSARLAVNVYMEQVRIMNKDERVAGNRKSSSYSALSL